MYQKLLVPIDESRVAEHVLPYVRTLATCFEIPVELLCVLDIDEANIDKDSDFVAQLRTERREHLEQLQRTFANPQDVTCTIATGKPAETIIDRAGDALETLIAMSTHSRSGVQRLFVGSVANKVLLGTKTPLLLIRGTEAAPDPKGRIGYVVVPLDGSALSELALPHAVVLASKLGAAVHLVRAYSLAKYAAVGDGGIALEYPKLLEQEKEHTQAYLEEKARFLEEQGVEVRSSATREGDAAVVVADLAQSLEGNALIVMSSHGKSGIGRWLLGGTADRIVRSSESPVLIIRPPLHG